MEARRREEMFENYLFSLGRIAKLGPAASSERVGPWLCIDAGLGTSAFNIAIRVDTFSGSAARALKLAQDWFDGRGVNSRFDLRSWADAEIIAAAALANFHHWWTEPALLLEPIPDRFAYPPEFEWQVLQSASDADAYSRLDSEEHDDHALQAAMARTAIDLSGCQLILGTVNGAPVARSMAITTGQMVGVHNVYVPPSQRGRGFGAAVTAAAIEAGRALGASAACLEASELGLPVYTKMGFRPMGEYVIFGKNAVPAE